MLLSYTTLPARRKDTYMLKEFADRARQRLTEKEATEIRKTTVSHAIRDIGIILQHDQSQGVKFTRSTINYEQIDHCSHEYREISSQPEISMPIVLGAPNMKIKNRDIENLACAYIQISVPESGDQKTYMLYDDHIAIQDKSGEFTRMELNSLQIDTDLSAIHEVVGQITILQSHP